MSMATAPMRARLRRTQRRQKPCKPGSFRAQDSPRRIRPPSTSRTKGSSPAACPRKSHSMDKCFTPCKSNLPIIGQGAVA